MWLRDKRVGFSTGDLRSMVGSGSNPEQRDDLVGSSHKVTRHPLYLLHPCRRPSSGRRPLRYELTALQPSQMY